MGLDAQRCISCHVVDEQRHFSIAVTYVHCSCLRPTTAILQWGSTPHLTPLPFYRLHYLFLLYHFHSACLSLSSLFPISFCWVSNASGCICLSPFLSQTVDWYGDTRLRVFLAQPQMGPWQHVRDQNVLYLSCQARSPPPKWIYSS